MLKSYKKWFSGKQKRSVPWWSAELNPRNVHANLEKPCWICMEKDGQFAPFQIMSLIQYFTHTLITRLG
jgi:hypothetical protein